MTTTKTAEQTKQIAKNLANDLSGGELITLTGDLGSGKTTFTQGLAEALGVTKRVNSPTFLVVKEYDIEKETIKKLVHADLYRLHSEQDIENIGLLESLQSSNTVVVLEWPEKMGSLLPKKRIAVNFEYVNEQERNITITKYE